MSYRVVRYDAKLRPQVVSLLQHFAIGDEALCDAYFRWKHEENPFVTAPVVYVALCDDRVVGMRGFQGSQWRSPESPEPKTLLCACDLVVAPAHRGKGLPDLIMRAALAALRDEGHRTLLSFSASPVTFRLSLRMGWRLIVPYAPWAKTTVRARIADRATARIRKLPWVWRLDDAPRRWVLRCGFDSMDTRWRRAGTASVFAREFDADFVAALAGGRNDRATVQARDAGYYRWRFRNPAAEYRFVYARGAGAPAYVALQRLRGRPGAEISVVDHAAADGRALVGLLDEIVRRGGFDRLSLWTVSLPPSMTDDLRALGFAPHGGARGALAGHPALLAFDLDDRGGAALPPAASKPPSRAWDLRMIDSDAY